MYVKNGILSKVIDLGADIVTEIMYMGAKAISKEAKRKKIRVKELPKVDNNGVPIGTIAGTRKLYRLPSPDARHKVIQGASGMGKTEWAINYIVNRALRGEGSVYLDNTDGSATQRILNSLSEDKLDKCIVLDHSDKRYPLPINIGSGKRTGDWVYVDALVGVWLSFFIDNLGVEGQWMTQELIQNAVKLCLYGSRSPITILEIITAVIDERYRESMMERTRDEDVVSWWERFNSMSKERKLFASESFMRRAGVVTGQKVLQHMLCQIHNHEYNYRKWIDEGYTVIVLCKESMGSLAVRIVMSIHVLNFWLAAMARDEELPSDTPRNPFVIVADEPQTWLPGNEQILDDIYSKGRKYGLFMVSMFQSTSQIAERNPNLIKKIMDNSPDLIVFKTNKSMLDIGGINANDISRYNFVAKVGDMPPIECMALPMSKEIADRSNFIEQQRLHWGSPWNDVASNIRRRKRGFSEGYKKGQGDNDSLSEEKSGESKPTPKTLFPLV